MPCISTRLGVSGLPIWVLPEAQTQPRLSLKCSGVETAQCLLVFNRLILQLDKGNKSKEKTNATPRKWSEIGQGTCKGLTSSMENTCKSSNYGHSHPAWELGFPFCKCLVTDSKHQFPQVNPVLILEPSLGLTFFFSEVPWSHILSWFFRIMKTFCLFLLL